MTLLRVNGVVSPQHKNKIMADRYWVGGTADWDGTAGTKWSTTSGGAGGAAVPTFSDDVYFDANSGSVTVTKKNPLPGYCLNFNATGFTGTLICEANPIWSKGNVTLGSGMTATTVLITMSGDGSFTINTNGVAFKDFSVNNVPASTSGTTVTLASDLTISGVLTVGSASNSAMFDADVYDITANNVIFQQTVSGKTTTINMGSGTWTITGKDDGTVKTWYVYDYSGTFVLNCETSSIVFTNTDSNYQKIMTHYTNGQTYNNVRFVNNKGDVVITKSNTFNQLKADTGPFTIKFTDGTTQTITSLDIGGTGSTTLIKLTGTSTGGWTISDTTGTNTVNYCDISYSTATGGAVWNAINSTNGGNNSGWNFINNGNFFKFFE